MVAGNLILANDLQGDALSTPWIYDFTAREFAEGRWVSALTDFDYPNPRGMDPHERSLFATTPPMDAVLMAPAALFFDWPVQWNMVLLGGLLINSAGVIWLSYELGCRGIGLVVAAVMSVSIGPIWIEALEGRTNCFFPGLTLMGLAGLLRSLPAGLESSFKKRLLWTLIAGLLGWWSFVIYPPGLALWIPIGIVLAGRHVVMRRGQGVKELVLPIAVIGVAYVLSLPFIWEMQRSGWVLQEFGHEECPPVGRTLALNELVKSNVGEAFRGFSFGFWLLAPFAMLDRTRRRMYAAFFVWATLLVFLSLGSCPIAERANGLQADNALWSWPLIGDTVWWAISYFHYYDRLAAAGCLLLSVLAAVGAEQLWEKRSRRTQIPALALIVYASVQVFSLHANTLEDPSNWQRVPKEPIADFLRTAKSGAVVELPYDQRHQYLTVLEHPGHPRVNTLRPKSRYARIKSPPNQEDRVWRWFDRLSLGKVHDFPPTRQEIAEAGVRWIFFEPTRCDEVHSSFQAYQWARACSDDVLRELESTLGRGRALGPVEQGRFVWEIAGAE